MSQVSSGTRRRARESALQIFFMADCAQVTIDDAERYFFGSLSEDAQPLPFSVELIQAFRDDREKVDGLIGQASEHWRLERMSAVDRNILRLGVVELLIATDVPRRVTLNEAVELAKRYGSEESARFVNGILDRIAENLGKQ